MQLNEINLSWPSIWVGVSELITQGGNIIKKEQHEHYVFKNHIYTLIHSFLWISAYISMQVDLPADE